MNKLIKAIESKDSRSLSIIAAKYPEKPKQSIVSDNAARLVDSLFRQFRQVFPAACATNLKTHADENAAKKQWIAAFAENGITSREQLSAGMQWARSNNSPFMPSPGQFIEHCKLVFFGSLGLPDPDRLYAVVMEYAAKRGFYSSAENYPFSSNAEYWLVTDLYSQMLALNLNENELKKQCEKKLKTMAERISLGQEIPQPKKQIPVLHIPVKKDVAMSYISNIKSMFKKSSR